MSLGMGILIGSIFARCNHISHSYHNELEHELRKQNLLKKEENKLKELEVKIKQFERYSDEELLDKFNRINPEEEFDVKFDVKGGSGNKIMCTYNSKDKVKNTQEFKDLQDEISRRVLIYRNYNK